MMDDIVFFKYIFMKLPFFVGVYMIDDILFNEKMWISIVIM